MISAIKSGSRKNRHAMADTDQNLTFSIITVTKNNLAGLRLTHKSLEEQISRRFEWIVIDGASEDQTTDFLKKTGAKWISEPDEGPFDAMNKGIKAAQGTYLLFLNSGDALAAPDTLKKIEQTAEKKPDFIYGDALETPDTRANGETAPFYKAAGRYKDLRRGMFTHHQAMFYSLEHIKGHNLRYSIIYDIASDYDFTARFLKTAKKIIYAPLPVCLFQGGGISQQRARDGRREEYMIRERLNLTSQPENVWIYLRQTMAWKLRTRFPNLYKKAKRNKNGNASNPPSAKH